MKPIGTAAAPRLQPPRQVESQPTALVGPAAGGPVAEMRAELEARLTAGEYERWLLPPEPRTSFERAVHILSLGAGVLALIGGSASLWFIVLRPVMG